MSPKYKGHIVDMVDTGLLETGHHGPSHGVSGLRAGCEDRTIFEATLVCRCTLGSAVPRCSVVTVSALLSRNDWECVVATRSEGCET